MPSAPDPDADAQEMWSDILDLVQKRVRSGSDQQWLVMMIMMCSALLLAEEHAFDGPGLKQLVDVALDTDPPPAAV